jgi:hypothetical protein
MLPGAGGSLVSGGPHPRRSGRCVGGGGGPALGVEGQAGEPAIWQALHGVLTGGARRKLEREAARGGIALGAAAEVAPILDLVRKGQAEAALKRAMALARAAPMAAAAGPCGGCGAGGAGRWGQAEAAFEEACGARHVRRGIPCRSGPRLRAAGTPEAALGGWRRRRRWGRCGLAPARGCSATRAGTTTRRRCWRLPGGRPSMCSRARAADARGDGRG